MKRITLTVGLDVDHDMREDDLASAVRDAIAENVALADELRYTSDGVHIAVVPTDPIAAAVDAQLAPLREELISVGRKLAQEQTRE